MPKLTAVAILGMLKELLIQVLTLNPTLNEGENSSHAIL